MLFTDADVVTMESLLAIDSEVRTVVTSEKLKLEGDNSIVSTAMNECAYWLSAEMQSPGAGYIVGMGIGPSHAQAVFFGSGSAISVPYMRLSNVVVTGTYNNTQSPLERWLHFKTLAALFRAAQNRKVNDRYEAKTTTYVEEARHAEGILKTTGLPLVVNPFPCPGSLREPGSGVWDSTNVSTVVNVLALIGANYYVAVTYVDSSQYVDQANKNNCESGPSQKLAQAVAIGNVLKVDITSLTPPTGVMPDRGISEGITKYLNATGWNVWVGTDPNYLYLQNATPIAIATKSYTLAGDPVLSGYILQPGQFPTRNFPFISGGGRLMRG